MKVNLNNLTALAVAGVMTFGAMSLTAEYAAAAPAEKHYEDGTSNEGSHKLRQEEEKHDKNLKEINANHRYTKDDKKYEKELRKEQARHDKEMRKIEERYGNHKE